MNYYQKMYDLLTEGSLGLRRQLRVAKAKQGFEADPQRQNKLISKNKVRAQRKGMLGPKAIGNPITRAQLKGLSR